MLYGPAKLWYSFIVSVVFRSVSRRLAHVAASHNRVMGVLIDAVGLCGEKSVGRLEEGGKATCKRCRRLLPRTR